MPRETGMLIDRRYRTVRVLGRVLLDRDWPKRPRLCRFGIHHPHQRRGPYTSSWRYIRECTRCSYWWESKDIQIKW